MHIGYDYLCDVWMCSDQWGWFLGPRECQLLCVRGCQEVLVVCVY